jgi:hypothetical protein
MTQITIDRALVEQVLETIEGLTRDRLFTAEWAGKHGATIAALRAAMAQTEPAQKQVTYSTGGLHLEAGFYSEVDLRRMLKALESMNAAARRAMEERIP